MERFIVEKRDGYIYIRCILRCRKEIDKISKSGVKINENKFFKDEENLKLEVINVTDSTISLNKRSKISEIIEA